MRREHRESLALPRAPTKRRPDPRAAEHWALDLQRSVGNYRTTRALSQVTSRLIQRDMEHSRAAATAAITGEVLPAIGTALDALERRPRDFAAAQAPVDRAAAAVARALRLEFLPAPLHQALWEGDFALRRAQDRLALASGRAQPAALAAAHFERAQDILQPLTRRLLGGRRALEEAMAATAGRTGPPLPSREPVDTSRHTPSDVLWGRLAGRPLDEKIWFGVMVPLQDGRFALEARPPDYFAALGQGNLATGILNYSLNQPRDQDVGALSRALDEALAGTSILADTEWDGSAAQQFDLQAIRNLQNVERRLAQAVGARVPTRPPPTSELRVPEGLRAGEHGVDEQRRERRRHRRRRPRRRPRTARGSSH